VTNVILAQQELSYRATHDELTGLCNRTVFVDGLQHALARGRRTRANTAVLFVDIDRFKVVNDTLGHASGDEVLTEIGKRLEGATRSMDRVGRIAGDEFIVMCSDVTGIEPVAQRAAELERLISQPIFLSNGRQPALHASIGIAFATGGDGDAEELLRDAHVAMRRAKEQGGTQVEIFDDALRVQAERRRELELALRVALDNHQIDVYFQPIVAVSSPRVLGVEALARFNHPSLGFIPPDEFIHVAEETDLILTLGIEVLGKACTQAASWRATDPDARDLYVSVNLSARQLYDPHLVKQVETVLRTTGLDPDALWLEITESVLMDDAPTAARIFAELRALGVHLVVDDFGTGYSSLAYLQAFPVEMLKIDRSFVMGLGEDESSEAIVRAIISLATSLKLRVVAEGVELNVQLEILDQLGCDSFQGWLCSAARPAAELDFSRVTLKEFVS
jgi:Amt family ammonium transporter